MTDFTWISRLEDRVCNSKSHPMEAAFGTIALKGDGKCAPNASINSAQSEFTSKLGKLVEQCEEATASGDGFEWIEKYPETVQSGGLKTHFAFICRWASKILEVK